MREMLLIAFFGLILMIGYVWFLNHQEKSAATYFSDLKISHPARYLREIKLVSGFDTYLVDYAAMNGFSSPKTEAPEFILGRWSMVSSPKRVSDTYESLTCTTPMLIENGRLTLPGAFRAIEPVTFSLRKNGQLVITLPSHKEKIVRLVSSGVYLHHIELTLPESDQTSYGYRCK